MSNLSIEQIKQIEDPEEKASEILYYNIRRVERDVQLLKVFNNTLVELKEQSKNYLAPVTTYAQVQYPSRTVFEIQRDLLNATMRRSENVREFHGRLVTLINAAVTAAAKESSEITEENSPKPYLELIAKEVFIAELPEIWKIGVCIARTKSFTEAFEIALEFERSCPIKYPPRLSYSRPTTELQVSSSIIKRSNSPRPGNLNPENHGYYQQPYYPCCSAGTSFNPCRLSPPMIPCGHYCPRCCSRPVCPNMCPMHG